MSTKAKRRWFIAQYKCRILKKADSCKRPGETCALHRREGLYCSSLAARQATRGRGELAALAPKAPGPQAKRFDVRPEDHRTRAGDRPVEGPRRARGGTMEPQKKPPGW